MTLKEAIESGKPFRRNGRSFVTDYFIGILDSDVYGPMLIKHDDGTNVPITIDFLMANDWETKTHPEAIFVNFYPDGSREHFSNKNAALIYKKEGAVTRRYILAFDGDE